jgi:hypothetical protein
MMSDRRTVGCGVRELRAGPTLRPREACRNPAAPPAALPCLPREVDGPVFRAPWEAQAFATAVALHERGLFAWNEFAERLRPDRLTIAAAPGEDDGSRY